MNLDRRLYFNDRIDSLMVEADATYLGAIEVLIRELEDELEEMHEELFYLKELRRG